MVTHLPLSRINLLSTVSFSFLLHPSHPSPSLLSSVSLSPNPVPFYIVSPIPLALVRRCISEELMSAENLKVLREVCYFLSACIVVSGFGKMAYSSAVTVLSNFSLPLSLTSLATLHFTRPPLPLSLLLPSLFSLPPSALPKAYPLCLQDSKW